MTDEEPGDSAKSKGIAPATIIIVVVVALFAGVQLAKTRSNQPTVPTAASGVAAIGGTDNAAGATMTSTHNDAVTDYEAALATGKPVYVLFHSLSCQPCVEISAVADKIMP
ncbi:MAG: hypothetical protein Q8K89_01795, partial [Actinomycetota bacterium]|nr:hypothetical protein [Actinomycetota bacterium]